MDLETGRQRPTEPKRYTWQQTQLMRGYKIMGASLAEDLSHSPKLVSELSNLVHNTPLSYAGVLRHHLTSDRPLPELIGGPFVRAFRATPQCTPEEAEFLTGLEASARAAHPPIDALKKDFREWAETRVGFLAKGFQEYILEYQIIAPITPEEMIKKSKEGARVWREANPAEMARIHEAAVAAIIDGAKPVIYTDEVRAKMQQWFDGGLNYKVVCELLKAEGIAATPAKLKYAVHVYEDLHYTPDEDRKKQREGFLKALEGIFKLSGSRAKTTDILAGLGYSPTQVKSALHQLGLRERVNWEKQIDPEKGETLGSLVENFSGGAGLSTREEYHAFVLTLKVKGIDIEISEGAYSRRRRRLS